MNGFIFRWSPCCKKYNVLLSGLLVFAVMLHLLSTNTLAQTVLRPKVAFKDSQIEDQDDMCIWVHPRPELSTVIASDKDAAKLFVYDLQGETLQTISLDGKPGNIDVRYNFPLAGQPVDIVAYVNRDAEKIVICRVDPATRKLARLGDFDAGDWPREIYGFCLYHSPNDGKFYAIASGKSSLMRQWELADDGKGKIIGIEKRTWQNGGAGWTEGLVADDETARLFAAHEEEGIYKYNADPADSAPKGELILPTGALGLTPDIEGITIYYAARGEGYLVVSNQGSDNFMVFERQAPHHLVKTFSVEGAEETDGIDVSNLNLGSAFPRGILLLHNNENEKKEILGCDYTDLGLPVDTEYWHPRKAKKNRLNVVPGPALHH
jgi:3-phytase